MTEQEYTFENDPIFNRLLEFKNAFINKYNRNPTLQEFIDNNIKQISKEEIIILCKFNNLI
tara:strand:+ start:2887 stop:3069 length:183 start_codon:yes stop_codon:yes gene_type:complete